MLFAVYQYTTRLMMFGLLVCVAGAVSANTPLHITLSSAGNGVVHIEVTNTSSVPKSFLTWKTVFEQELSEDVFSITPVGRGMEIFDRAEFTGRHFRRQAPTAADFQTIDPGDAASVQVRLSDYYHIPANGSYRVQYIGEALVAGTDMRRAASDQSAPLLGGSGSVSMESRSISMQLQGSAFRERARNPDFNQCTTEQRAIIVAANQAAEDMTTESRSSLQGLSPSDRRSSPRYNEWFGAYTDGRFNRVLDTFGSIESALSDEVMTYDCSCDLEGVYAYVFPTIAYEIYLCPVFWQTTLLGAGSQAGTIVHEVSHFLVVAGTDDHVYGQELSADLADTDPDTAINNADNITFFAENDPVIPLIGEVDDPSDSNITLVLDDPTSGSVAVDERVFYRVVGSDLITLQTLSGDVDLLVHADSDRTTQLCSSNLVDLADEVCEISAPGVVYLTVVGYKASDYVITARAANRLPTNDDVIDLALNEPVTGDVDNGQFVVYRVTNAENISVETHSGDADLFVFDELNFTQEFLVCQSAEDFADRPIETCAVPDGQTVYAVVSGYLASNYTIEAQQVEISDGATDEGDASVTPETNDEGGSAGNGSSRGGGGAPAVVFLLLCAVYGMRRKEKWIGEC